MEGFLLIDKPKGWTSFDVVAYIRNIVARAEGKKPRRVKVGHTGTLDPLATGLLVLCVGSYTKKVQELIKHDKTYEAEIMLDGVSDTGDSDGTIQKVSVAQADIPTTPMLKKALEGFLGEIDQVPPAYSAVKVNGKRAYELAREGRAVTLKSRRITVYEARLLSYEWPQARVEFHVSSGTYIRTLAEDIGRSLGVGGYLTVLRRTAIESFEGRDTFYIEGGLDPKSITIDNIRDKLLA